MLQQQLLQKVDSTSTLTTTTSTATITSTTTTTTDTDTTTTTTKVPTNCKQAINQLEEGINTNILLKPPSQRGGGGQGQQLVNATCIRIGGQAHTHIPCSSLLGGGERDCVDRNRVTDSNTCTDAGYYHAPFRSFNHYNIARLHYQKEGLLGLFGGTPGGVYNPHSGMRKRTPRTERTLYHTCSLQLLLML